jgi:general transcription factor 3C polypeptide 5 (transcription factor C subunit 1)
LKPESPFARGVASTQLATENILLKISVPKRTGRKRKRGSDDPFELHESSSSPKTTYGREAEDVLKLLEDNKDQYIVNIPGRLPENHQFRSLQDFQYASFDNPLMRNVKNVLLSDNFDVVKTFRLDPSKGVRHNEEVQPPPIFQLQKHPFPWAYRQNPHVKFIERNGKLEAVNSQMHAKVIVHTVSYDSPTVPDKSPVELPPESQLDYKVKQAIQKIREAFKKRPLMTRRVQLWNIRPHNDDTLKKTWAYLGYMFRSGPFKDVLIAFGVDPRTNFKYRIYQSVTLQIPDKNSTDMVFGEETEASVTSKLENYIFNGKRVWIDGKTWQVCDILDPLLKEFIGKAKPPASFDVSVHTSTSSALMYNRVSLPAGMTTVFGRYLEPF